VEATVEVDDQYKPSGISERNISVAFDREIPATLASLPSIEKAERGLMFLSHVAGHAYIFSDPFLGATPLNSLPPQSPGNGIVRLETALASVLQSSDPDDRTRALELLHGFDTVTAETTSVLQTVSRSPDADLALSALAVLMKTSGTSDLEALLRQLQVRLESYVGEGEPPALVNLGTDLGQISDPRALEAVEGLSSSKFVLVRRGAMQSLRSMKTTQAAATLVRRLDDPDGYVHYLAVISLAEAFGKTGDYSPSMYLFDKNPDFYSDLWKTWWLSQGSTQ
jgi:hypothetical protein